MQIDSASPQPDLVPSKIPNFKYQATHNGQRPSSSTGPQKNSSQKISLAPIKSTVHKHKGKDPLHGGSKSKPIFKPINSVSIDLNLANPIHTTNLTPPSPVQINPPISLSVHRSHNKKPPDPSTLPTLTYHEYARNAENAIQSPQDVSVTRVRDRSISPGRSYLVDGGNDTEAKALRTVSGGNGSSHSGPDTAPETGSEQK